VVVTTSSEAGARYRHFDAMPLGLGVIRDGFLVYANASMLELLGLTAAEALGRPLSSFIPRITDSELLLDRHLRRMRGDTVPSVYEFPLTTPAGERRRVEISVTVEGQDAVVLLRDVSARAHRRAVLQRLAELGAGLPGMRTEQEVLSRVFDGLTLLGVTFAYLMPLGAQALLERLYVPPELSQEAEDSGWTEGLRLTGTWSPLLERTWKEGAAYEAEFAQEASRFAKGEISDEVQARLKQAGLHVIGVRIEVSGMRRAVLVVAAPWLREEELPPLRLFGAQVSAALEAALTISQLSAQNTALAALNRLAAMAATAQEPQDFFGPGAKEITRLLSCDALGLFLRKDGLDEIELVFSQGLDEPSIHYYSRLPVRGSLSGQAMEQGSAMVVEVEACSGPMREHMERLGHTTLAVVPLRVSSRLVGTLLVAFRQRRGLTHLERETLQAMGTHFAAATESHRLLTEVRRRADDLALIHEAGHNLVATVKMDVLMQIGVEGLRLITRARDALLFLLDAEGRQLEFRASVNPRPELAGYSLAAWPPESSVVATALQSRAPFILEDAEKEPRLHPDARQLLGVTSGLVLPLVIRDRAIGVACIIESQGPRRFTPQEVERASAITNQLALALEQARLIEDLKESYAELARTQEQLVQRERLAALGELAAIVAHEVRNPLGVIFNSVSYIRRLIGAGNPALPMVEIVAEEADRLNHIVDDLLYFARPASPSLSPVPLLRLLEDAVRAALTDATGVTVEWFVEDELPVPVDERMIRQAFINLALNAVQAMPQGGTLRLGLRRAPGPRPEVQVEFTDTGSGIPTDMRARIFEPFFTTKAKGTGLGLAIVKRIIESHAGRVVIESEPGRGTTFRLFLPFEPEAAQPLAQVS
jgi:two-component system sensor histidine kinase HydH